MPAEARVRAALREEILRGVLEQGAPIREGQVAIRLAVSRTPVREALRRLASEGLVEVLPNRGARVRVWSEDAVDEAYELRALLEAHGAARAASRISQTQMEELTDICVLTEAASERGRDGLDDLAELNSRFHSLILDASGSPLLVNTVASVVQLPLVMTTFHRYSPQQIARSLGHHREIVEALTIGDAAWAQSVMCSHIRAARAVLGKDSPIPPSSKRSGESRQ